MSLLTRLVLRYKWVVIVFWVAVTFIGIGSVGRITGALSQEFALPGQEGYETDQAILKVYGTNGGRPALVPVVTLPAGTTVDSPGVHDQIRATFAQIQQAMPGALISSYATDGDRAFVSSDGRTTFGLVYPAGKFDFAGDGPSIHRIEAAIQQTPIPGATIQVSGITALQEADSGGGGLGVFGEAVIGGIGALVVLVIVFGSALAIVPVIMAIVAIMGTFLLIGGLMLFTDVSFIIEFLIALIGLGVAIDYSLLIVMRWREELALGKSNREAVQHTMETAGNAVVHSGSTVAVGLVALVVLPVPFLRSIGFGGMLIPLVSVAVAITLLPVVLDTIGRRVDWPHRKRNEGAGRRWTAWATLVVRRRWVAAAAAALVLGSLLAAATFIKIGDPQADSLPSSGDAKAGFQQLERSGISAGAFEPTLILAPEGDAKALVDQLAHVEGVRAVTAPSDPTWRRGGKTIVAVFPNTDAATGAGRATLARVKSAAHEVSSSARVGGVAAESRDFSSSIYGQFPLMVALIALVTFLLLVRAFRSLLLPFKAVLFNILSVGATWGALVLVWQKGWGSDQIWGIPATGSITLWVPLMVFAFLFGLSMDYEVFIISRMREQFDKTGSTSQAIVDGIGHTGRLVTFGALILFLAFAALAAGPGADIKIFATALAAGILLDATVVRAMLVPALVALLGDWNWWLPHWPARLLRVEPSVPAGLSRQEAEGSD
jgi:RND superfamily putative drug exporter